MPVPQHAVIMASIICECTIGMFQLMWRAFYLVYTKLSGETSCSLNMGTQQKHFCIRCWMILAPRNKWSLKRTKVIPWMLSYSVLSEMRYNDAEMHVLAISLTGCTTDWSLVLQDSYWAKRRCFQHAILHGWEMKSTALTMSSIKLSSSLCWHRTFLKSYCFTVIGFNVRICRITLFTLDT